MVTKIKLKALNPGTADMKYTGSEPTWETQPVPEQRLSRLTEAFSWYNYHYGKKDARDMLVSWLEHCQRKTDVKLLRKVSDADINLTLAWLCRMNLVGLELNDQEAEQLESRMSAMLQTVDETKPVVETTADTVVRPNIQERLREKMLECAGEIEGMFDDFIAQGARMSAEFKPITVIRGKNIMPSLVGDIAVPWKQRLDELEQALTGEDEQLVEGYSNFNKLQLRAMIKFCETVINDCSAYVQIKKMEVKPRKVKKVSPEQRARKFRTQPEHAELALKSLPAAALVGASEAWLYETKKRKLIHVVADQHVGQFTVKNNQLIGVSTVDTQQKTLRKPAETIAAIMAAGKPATRKIFKDLTTVETQFNGRGTDNLVVLRAW